MRVLGSQVSQVALTAVAGAWTITLLFHPNRPSPTFQLQPSAWFLNSTSIPLQHASPRVCSVRPKQLQVDLEIMHAAPAYLGEAFAVQVEVTNKEGVEVEVVLDLFLQPRDDNSGRPSSMVRLGG